MAVRSPSAQASPELLELRHRIRHSASHIMADAVLQLFPEAKYAIGPPIEDGFYYDFDVSRPFTPEDLERIEALMRERIAEDVPFIRTEVSREEAKAAFRDQPYKQEIIDGIPEGDALYTLQHGPFTDLCGGIHVEQSGQVAAFKLLSVAGAYWRGDERNPMLQRIYGTAWESQEALDGYLEMLEEAERRDHRRLGRELDLFSVHDEIGPGLIVWHPKGGSPTNSCRELLARDPLPPRLQPCLLAAHRAFQPLAYQRTLGLLPGKYVRPHGVGRAGILPQADELPVPHHDLPLRPAKL